MSNADVRLDESAISTEGIPTEVQTLQRWLCWENGDDDNKRAVASNSDKRAGSLDDATSLNRAKHSLKTNDYGGVALVLNEKLVGIRLLDALEGPFHNPTIEDWAEEIISSIDSYAEVSPSGEDVLLLAKGEIPSDTIELERVEVVSTKDIVPITGKALDSVAAVQHRQEELETFFEKCAQQDSIGDEGLSIEVKQETTLSDVRETMINSFDEEEWHLTEAILSTHATLFVEGIQNCTGLIVVGQSGAGKTTALKFFEGLNSQFYRSDEVTPASFVTHDASLSEDELAEVDLLPRIKHKSLLCRDMETWFSGDKESIRTTMSRMTHLMDGEGLTRDSGSHGKRGYEGDFRFSFIGASTPLKSRAWEVMGNAGYRFVFYHKKSRPDDQETLQNNLFGESSYEEKVSECRQKIQSFLHGLWNEHGGYGGISDDNISFSDDAKEAVTYLAKVVKFSRATVNEQSGNEDPVVKREDAHRIGAVLREIAKGRALINGETTVELDDVVVSSRVALSTMPSKRRPLVRTLLNPANDGQLTRNEVQDALSVSKPTALDRMELMEDLEIADFSEIEDDARGTKRLELKEGFGWPDVLPFPDR
jgi:predicted transcriptional regulator